MYETDRRGFWDLGVRVKGVSEFKVWPRCQGLHCVTMGLIAVVANVC